MGDKLSDPPGRFKRPPRRTPTDHPDNTEARWAESRCHFTKATPPAGPRSSRTRPSPTPPRPPPAVWVYGLQRIGGAVGTLVTGSVRFTTDNYTGGTIAIDSQFEYDAYGRRCSMFEVRSPISDLRSPISTFPSPIFSVPRRETPRWPHVRIDPRALIDPIDGPQQFIDYAARTAVATVAVMNSPVSTRPGMAVCQPAGATRLSASTESTTSWPSRAGRWGISLEHSIGRMVWFFRLRRAPARMCLIIVLTLACLVGCASPVSVSPWAGEGTATVATRTVVSVPNTNFTFGFRVPTSKGDEPAHLAKEVALDTINTGLEVAASGPRRSASR